MSRIDDLIRQHCPNGVQFKLLADVTTRSSNIKWSEAGDEKFRYIDLSSVDRVTRKIGETETISAASAPSRAQQIVREGDVIFATTRPTQMRLAVIPANYGDQIASTGYCVLRPVQSQVLTNFLAHLLGAERFRRYVQQNQVPGNYPSIPDRLVRAFRIPVPPLDIQREIARVLDLLQSLEAELEAELEARQLQYAHYRARLLDFEGTAHAVAWEPLSHVADFVNGKAHERVVDPDGEISLMTSRFISTQGRSARRVRREDVLTPAFRDQIALVMSDLPNGRALARAFFVDADDRYAANQRVCLLRSKDAERMLPRFLYYVLDRNRQLLSYDSGVDQTHLKKGHILGVNVPVPPLAEQARIVSILDKFDALVNDLSVGLPAELSARRTQYEYYCDRLLSFEEAA